MRAIHSATAPGLAAILAVAQADNGFKAASLAAGPNSHEATPGSGSQAGFRPIKVLRDKLPKCSAMCAAMAAPAE